MDAGGEEARRATTSRGDASRRSWIMLDPLRPMDPPEPVEGCMEHLRARGVRASETRMTPHLNANETILCGTTQAVTFRRGPGKIRWSRSPRVSCRMALALARFEEIVQEEARRLFDDRVYAARHVGTYNCREMAAYDGWVSEHSYANAIDLVSLTLARGTEISVRTHYFDPGPRGELLREVARRAFEEDVFSVVLTPAFDDHHKGHLHLDMAHYRAGEY